jgi:type I restriction enzyme S subunit
MEKKVSKLKSFELSDVLASNFSGVWGDAPGDADVNVQVIKVSDVSKDRKIIVEKLTPRSVPARVAKKLTLFEGDIVVVKSSGSSTNIISGRSAYMSSDLIGKDIIPSNFTLVLRADTTKILPRYLWHYLGSVASVQHVHSIVSGSTYPNIRVAQYLKMPVLVPVDMNGKPDLVEQKRIADKLDSAFSSTEKGLEEVASQRTQAEELKQAILASVFSSPGSRVFKLIDIAEVNPRKDVGKFKATDSVSFVPMESVDEVTGTIVSKQARNLGAVVRGYTAFQNGDVIFAKITPCMENGKCAVAEGLENGLGFGSTEFYVVRPKENVSAEYLWHFLRQERVRVEAKKHFTGAAGHKRVPKSFIENLELPVPQKNGKPDLIQQQKAVAEIDKKFAAADELLGLLEKQEQAFSSLRLSLLDAALKPKVEQSIASPLQYTPSPRMFDIQQAVAQIIKRFQRGEVVIAKVLYIGQAIYGVPTNIPFTPQHFGPYDGIVKKAVMAGLSPSNRFFARRGTGTTQVLTLGENGGAILRYSTSELARKVNLYLDDMMPYFYQTDSASIERLATICKIIEDEKTADEAVVKAKLQEWKPNRFTDQDVSRTLVFIKKRGWDKRLIK